MANPGTDDQRCTVAEAARLIGISPARLKVLADRGDLPVERTLSGYRLFKLGDVRRFQTQRERDKTP